MQEAQYAPRRVTEQQWNASTGRRADARSFHCSIAIVVGDVLGTRQIRRAQIAQRHEDGVGVERDFAQGVGVGNLVAWGPLRFENRDSTGEVVSSYEGDIGIEEFGKNLTDPVQNLLSVRRGCRHEFFGHLSDQFIESALVQQVTFAGGERRDVAEQTAEGLGE